MRAPSLLSNLDLHTIRVLHTLLMERSVSKAALRLGMHQPAVSVVLKRLRHLSGDPLLVRAGHLMIPTDAGMRMIEPIAGILQATETLFSTALGFDPQTTERTFHLAATDSLDPVFLPLLVSKIKRLAPCCRIDIHPLSADSDYSERLAEGGLDVVVGNWVKPPGELYIGSLFTDEIVCLVSRSHPAIQSGWTTKSWLNAQHITNTPTHLGARNVIDEQLQSLGLQRNIAARCAHFNLMPQMVASSQLVLTTGLQFCRRFTEALPLAVVDCPIHLPKLAYYQLWHERSHTSSSCRWLRDQVKSVAGTLR
ncbi:LysR family transcriptional regulator [Hydrogenophaga sp. 2FB]|uniref:LysR family transcriptional regulator n=1 Tax=Hydrogenophaga sp. 2FB TaxID=2502187 RepID=UPI0010F5DAED|nr:LysR family transcriptional regulator [Hydrogenophaga sp. 2FB]